MPVSNNSGQKVRWPGDKRFAFTFCDDTDWVTVDNVKPIYDALADLGFRTTKTAWMSKGTPPYTNAGLTAEDAGYRRWLLELKEKGFEIASHNASPATSERNQTIDALDKFHDIFGDYPATHCNHVGCRENIYWGDARLSAWTRSIYKIATFGKRSKFYRGHLAGDPLFWGDVCRDRIRYVRNFIFQDLNTLAQCSAMPYYDPSKPYVSYWFAATDAGSSARFLRNFTYRRIDDLVEAGGLCIAYVHFAAGFASDGALLPEIRNRLEYIAAKGGWFAPVSEILDHLRQDAGPEQRTIPTTNLFQLEARWLYERMKYPGVL